MPVDVAGRPPVRRVCIVTPGYISSTPRVVREADALTEAGFDVRVVFTQGQLESVRAFDEDVLRSRTWRSAAYTWSNDRLTERWEYLKTGVRHRVAQALPQSSWELGGIVERAEGRVFPELARLAEAEPADLYIGHYPTGLAAACRAAAAHKAHLGYDVEDLYAETFPHLPALAEHRARITRLEERYVPRCQYVSAVSRPVADEFSRRYPGTQPVVVHNCHPWSDRDRLDHRTIDGRTKNLSLYWYSQTLGLDRGIQDAIRAAGLVSPSPQIHLRGASGADVRDALRLIAREAGAADALVFHEPCRPDDLLSRAVEHDVGLALETDDALNRSLTVTNKLFLYLTAGLAIAASDVLGQQSVLSTCPAAGRLHPRGDHHMLAQHLSEWGRDARALGAAKAAALDAARTRWNWEQEGRVVVETVRAVLDHDGRGVLADCG